jgi:hypothetical protein
MKFFFIACAAVVLTAAPGETRAPVLVQQKAAPDSDPHLALWLKLDEAEGKSAADSSGKGRKGVLHGEAEWVTGRTGQALQLDGKKAFIEITGYRGISGAKPRTVAAWIRTKASRGEIVSWGLDEAGMMWTFGFIRGHVGVTPKGGYLYMKEEIHDGKWHHVAVVLTGGDPPGLQYDVKLFLDGKPADIHSIGLLDLLPIDTGSEMDVQIGKGFEGCLDDVRLYDRALSKDEITALFEVK